MSTRNTLPKSRRISGVTAIPLLFEKGKSIAEHPIRALFTVQKSAQTGSLKVGFSVPKKRCKKAVLRNLTRRRMKEAFRTQQHRLLSQVKQTNSEVTLFFIYQGNHPSEFNDIQHKIFLVLERLQALLPNIIPDDQSPTTEKSA
ncbi:MAG TPA: ribonuclease P protein component [Luteibaculaceae bacterium]|nr:ribonuclease P protein component [Luteibaculaceae bacterium]